jgi:predicted permease
MLAWWGLRLLLVTAPPSIPRADAVSLDARVLAVTLGLSLAVSIVTGLVPTFQARRLALTGALQSDPGRGGSASKEHRRFRSALVVSELALAVMLMVGAGLLIRSLWRLQQIEPGFEAAGVLKAEFLLPGSRYPQRMSDFPAWPEIRRFHAEAVHRLASLPGVTAVTIAGRHPLDRGFTSSIRVVGREAEGRDWPEPAIRFVDENYVSTMRLLVLAGRAFLSSDDASAPPVLLVNQEAQQRYFAGRDPIGQRIRLWGADRTVVGVVEGERVRGRAEPAPPAVYVPTGQSPVGSGSMLVRTAGDPAALAATLRRVIQEIDPQVPLFGIEPLAHTLDNSEAERRFTTVVLGAFAGVALLLAIAGVHGVLTYTVARRTREIGIRMALGADRARVRSLVLGQGATLVALGLTLGILGALVLSQVLRSMLFGVGRNDPITLAGVAIVLGAVALFASWLPARRASQVDPMVALRTE